MTILTNKHQFIDPVCHMNVVKNGTVPPFSYGDDIYYFCADACREAFVADPTKYLEVEAPKKKGIWGRYLDRLNKSTGGKPQCCH